MNPKSFFGELKRRNVYKGRVAYIVAVGAFSGNRAGFSCSISKWVVRLLFF